MTTKKTMRPRAFARRVILPKRDLPNDAPKAETNESPAPSMIALSEKESAEEVRELESKPEPFFSSLSMVTTWDTRATGKIAGFKILSSEYDIHPMKGLRAGNGRTLSSFGQRMHFVICKADDQSVLFAEEVMLLKWSDDSINGQTFQILMDATGEGEHPLAMLTSDRKNGDHVYINAWLINDEEELVEKPKIKWADMSATRQSAIMCSVNEDFHDFCRDKIDILEDMGLKSPDHELHDREFSAEFVRRYCALSSRADFKLENEHGEMARAMWAQLLDVFYAWREQG